MFVADYVILDVVYDGDVDDPMDDIVNDFQMISLLPMLMAMAMIM